MSLHSAHESRVATGGAEEASRPAGREYPAAAVSPVRWQTVIALIFCAALVHALVQLGQGWENSVLDRHGFRQSQTAISTYYLLRGSSWLAYETPVLGPNWSIPMEFPTYQWLVAAWVRLTGMPLDSSGRLVSVGCFLGSLVLVYAGLRHWGLDWSRRLVILTLLLTSPLYLFWSRTFMIESLALLLGLAFLVLVARYLRSGGLGTLATACLCGCLAGLTKITTFYTFTLAAAALLLGKLYPSLRMTLRGEPAALLRQIPLALGLLVGGALIPLAATLAWTAYADGVKETVPLAADYITSTALRDWNFGSLEQRLSSKFWYSTVLGRMGSDIFGARIGTLAALSLIAIGASIAPAYRSRIMVSAGLFLAALSTFTNLHYVHDYYQYANAIFLLVGVGFALVSMLESQQPRWSYCGIAGFALLTVIGCYGHNQGLRRVARHDTPPEPIVAEIRKRVPQDGIILIYGRGWSSAIPYYAERRAIMDPRYREPGHPKIQAALASLGDTPLAGVVSCGVRQRDPEGLRQRLESLRFETSPAATAGTCEFYQRSERHSDQPTGE